MTLAKIIDILKMIALKHPNVNSAYEGNIYDILNSKPDNKYASVVITQQSHTTDETYDHYGFVIFYVDRLVDDLEENRVQIQSIGKSMLGNIITAFCNEFEAECDNIIYQPFTQRFTDETAGVYCTITIDIIKDAYCAERYWDESWSAPIVTIKNVDMSITITENGHYVVDYDPTTYTGIGKVDIDVELNTEPYYNDGYENGYNQGYAEGEQVSYNTGYEQGQADVAANARVLEVTENGVYQSKFSDPIMPTLVTGVYNDGTGFYNYTELSGAVYNTKIAGSIDSRLEFWYKGDNIKSGDGYNLIIGSGDDDNSDCFQVRYLSTVNDRLWIEVGNSRIEVNDWDDTVWHHLIISKAEGFWIDGEWKGDFSPSNTINGEFFINGIGYSVDSSRNANGTFGMIKIDDVVIIPTADGFLNVNTGELLEIVKYGSYIYTENTPKYGEGELYKTINVNVLPKVEIAKLGIKFGYSSFSEVPEWLDSYGITDFSNMFYYCSNLKTIPEIDTSNATVMSRMFYYCGNLTSIPQLNTSNVTDMTYMFASCGKLQTIPQFDTRNVTNMSNMFYYSSSLTSIPQLDTSNVSNMERMFYGCGSLTTLPQLDVSKVTNISNYFRSGGGNVTDVGGWKNLKIDWNDNYGLVLCPNLTYQSCINILNGLYDFVGNGEGATKTLKVHQNFLDTVGDEISIGTNKGWIITA